MGQTATKKKSAPRRAPRETLTRLERLRDSRGFVAVFRRGKCFRDSTMRIHYRETDRARSRVGLVVSRKVGNSAVRSRVKRRLRHVFRESKGAIPGPMDVVLVANPRHGEASFDAYRQAFGRFLEWIAARS